MNLQTEDPSLCKFIFPTQSNTCFKKEIFTVATLWRHGAKSLVMVIEQPPPSSEAGSWDKTLQIVSQINGWFFWWKSSVILRSLPAHHHKTHDKYRKENECWGSWELCERKWEQRLPIYFHTIIAIVIIIAYSGLKDIILSSLNLCARWISVKFAEDHVAWSKLWCS